MVDIISEEYTENSISTSRTFQEMLKIEHGDSDYRKLAALLDTSMPYIDSLAENIGTFLGSMAVKQKYDEQYFNPKYGRFKNYFTRNIYIDQNKKQEMEKSRSLRGFAVSAATETAVKFGARAVQAWVNHNDRIKTLGEIYALLCSYTYCNDGTPNKRNAIVELNKMRDSLPLKPSQRKTMVKKYGLHPLDLIDLPTITALSGEGGGALKDNISYMLYAIYCQKHGDNEQDLDTLLDYYNLLGYHRNYAMELIRENKETYDKITDDQRKYLKIARGMVRDMFVTIPEISIERLKSQAETMAKYDPYSIRRNKTQNVIGGVATTLSGIYSKRPDLVIQGGATALSQLELENNDNALEFIQKMLQKNGVDNDAVNLIFKQGKDMLSKTKENVNSCI